jgi:hypothetical protein
MKKPFQISLFSLSLCGLIIIISQGCCEENCYDPNNPECENHDPCQGKSQVTALMKIGYLNSYMAVNGDENFLNEDSIFCAPVDDRGLYWATHRQSIGFKSLTPGAKTTWKLGSETITDSFFSRIFQSNKGIMGKYSVTLMVENDPDLHCFPLDDGKDTLTKTITFAPNYELPIMGVYKVLFEGENDSSLVEIRPWAYQLGSFTQQNFKIATTQSNSTIALINFRNMTDTFTNIGLVCTYTGHNIQFGDQARFNTPAKGSINLNHNTITAEYWSSYELKNIPYRKYKFKGRKIQ